MSKSEKGKKDASIDFDTVLNSKSTQLLKTIFQKNSENKKHRSVSNDSLFPLDQTPGANEPVPATFNMSLSKESILPNKENKRPPKKEDFYETPEILPNFTKSSNLSVSDPPLVPALAGTTVECKLPDNNGSYSCISFQNQAPSPNIKHISKSLQNYESSSKIKEKEHQSIPMQSIESSSQVHQEKQFIKSKHQKNSSKCKKMHQMDKDSDISKAIRNSFEKQVIVKSSDYNNGKVQNPNKYTTPSVEKNMGKNFKPVELVLPEKHMEEKKAYMSPLLVKNKTFSTAKPAVKSNLNSEITTKAPADFPSSTFKPTQKVQDIKINKSASHHFIFRN